MAEVASVGNQMTIEQIIESQATNAKETRNTGELGKNDFLKLLITQVQNQDPLNPTSDQEFIAQLAQFSALEQMQNLNKSFAYSTGFAMMGKHISAEIPDKKTGEVKYVSGLVEMVRLVNGEVHLVVGEDEVPIDKITQVSDVNIDGSGSVTDYSSIIGMLGKATITNDDSKSTSIEGIISSVTKGNDGIYANLDEVEILPYNLELGSFETEEEYVEGMTGKEVTLRFKDKVTGALFKVTGILREGYMGDDGKLRLILNGVKVPADSIYSTQKIDLLSTEQLLLNEILKELKNLNGTEPTDGSTGEGDAGDTGTESVM